MSKLKVLNVWLECCYFFSLSEHISGCPQKYHIIRTSFADDYFTPLVPERRISYLYYTLQQESALFFSYKHLTQSALFYVYKNAPFLLRQFQTFHEKLHNTKCEAFCILKKLNANCLCFFLGVRLFVYKNVTWRKVSCFLYI